MPRDLRSESPFWLAKSGFVHEFRSLKEDIATDVAIIGSGISGALAARALIAAGYDTAVIDRRHIAAGSTAASTALLQYDIDLPLYELSGMIGRENAVRAYELSQQALKQLIRIARDINAGAHFRSSKSQRIATDAKGEKLLEKEFSARQDAGFDVELMGSDDVKRTLGCDARGALLSNESAVCDPYLLTHQLLQDVIARGCNVYDKTEIKYIERSPRRAILHTSTGAKITAAKVVIACGYESIDYLPKKIAKLSSTYAFVTEPLAAGEIWSDELSFWDTGEPYIYGRKTSDNRIIFGGGDEDFYDPDKRDSLISRKTQMLHRRLAKLFPDITATVDYAWAGSFIETGDGLPYIGTIRQRPHTYFALGYGGNGITFSQLAAGLIAEMIGGKVSKDAKIFSFDR